MARPEVEREADAESIEDRPSIGNDPARTPQNDGEDAHRVVSPDEQKVEEHEREQRREDETDEEKAEHVKNA